MKECEFEEDPELCPDYDAKESGPGFVDLTCYHWREKYIDEDRGICDAPPGEEAE